MSNNVTGALALAALSLLSACTTPSSGQVFPRNEARTAWTVVEGRVSDVKPVQIEGNKRLLVTEGGGHVRYELGRTIRSRHGRDLAGASVGQAVEELVTRQNGLQITIDLDRGETIAIVQAADITFAHVNV
jgi:outer membrane lipoprotein SlyB